MTKPEIIEKLIAAEIEFDDTLSKKELEALLPEDVKNSDEEKTEVTVLFDNTSRVYSKEVHGDNFLDLANEFATKRKGTIA